MEFESRLLTMRHLLCRQPNLGPASLRNPPSPWNKVHQATVKLWTSVNSGRRRLRRFFETQIHLLAKASHPVTQNIPLDRRTRRIGKSATRQQIGRRRVMAPVSNIEMPDCVTSLTDDQLRAALLARGLNPGPIVTSTRYFHHHGEIWSWLLVDD